MLHIVQSLDTGGAERVVAEYGLAHDRDRYSPEVCCVFEGGYLVPMLESAGVPVHALRRRSKLDPVAFFRLARLIAARRFDVVHNHNFTALAIGWPAAAAAGVPTLVRTEHNVSRRTRPLRRLLSRLAATREDAQIAVSDAVRESHVAAGRLPALRFATVWNGISDARLLTREDRADLRRRLGFPPGATICLSVGSLTEQKHFANLLRAAALVVRDVPDALFAVAGAGPEGPGLLRLADELGLAENVWFLGRTTDVPALLGASDMFVLSSEWEGLPITILEAMAAGLPCVATRVGGVEEAIEDGVSGLVVEPGDPDALAGGILTLAEDEGLREKLARSARAVYERSFTAERMVRETEALYDLASLGCSEYAANGRIRVLYVIGQLSFGGAERQVAELATRLPKERYEPIVCCLSEGGPLADELRRAGVRVVCVGKRSGAGSGASMALARLVHGERPAVIHSYLFSANWRTLLVGRLARVPLVITSVRNVDIHGMFAFTLFERALSRLNDRVVANAQAVKDYVAGAHWIPRDRINVIMNGVAFERVESEADVASAREAGDAPGRPTVLAVASLTPKKDHATLLRAASAVAREVPDVLFVLVGGGRLREKLEREAADLGISRNVAFRGELSDVAPALREADVCALTSLKEGCSNFIMESMLAGRPVVATDAGGNRELVEDGVTGYVVPLRDDAAVAKRIVELLADPSSARGMGARGRERARRLFGVQRMVDETVRLYEAVLNARVPGLVAWSLARAARTARGEKGGRRGESEAGLGE
ncbi:MAG: glycosyltransferase [Candidatus Eisenbacteria bacterium]|nr:glycosyltransferase [Candidatus Eisenbacteria bacterium]